jgi:hypothetical protein
MEGREKDCATLSGLRDRWVSTWGRSLLDQPQALLQNRFAVLGGGRKELLDIIEVREMNLGMASNGPYASSSWE